MISNSLFFPHLKRRAAYRLTRNGTYYADYNEYRQEIREDCLGRCIYCDCHENELAGQECMNLDHFRPKSIQAYAHLVNDPNNLVWTCFRCNRLKWNHWPAVDVDSTFLNDEGFIDPFTELRTEYFEIQECGKLKALKPPASYMIELLGLNSHTPRKRRERRFIVSKQLEKIEQQLNDLKGKSLVSDAEKQIILLLEESKQIQERYLDFNLY